MAMGDVWFWLASWLVIAMLLWMFDLHEDRESDSRPVAELLRILPAFYLALVVRYWLRLLAGDETDPAGELLQSVVLGIVYVVLVFVFVPVVARFNDTLGRAKTSNLVGVIFVLGYVLPSWIQEKREEKANAIHASAVRSLIEMQVTLRTRWVADIRAAGAHGPAGQTPPMLAVEIRGDGIEVSNLVGRDICLRIARVSAPNPGGNAHRCDFDELSKIGRCLIVRASSSMSLSRKKWPCNELPLEFRVGDFEHDEVGWWSDSALSDLEGVAERLGSTTWLTDRLSDSELQKETARLAKMTADAQRAVRWRNDLESLTRLRD
jgi:hypothetical protein